MVIRTLENIDEARWDSFVRKTDSSTFFHQVGWKKVIEKTFGHKSHYLFAEEDGEITGILPLFIVDSIFFGKRLISSPYSPYCGCCASRKDIRGALTERVVELSKEYKAKYLELRNREMIPGMPANTKHVTMVLNLTGGEEAVWPNLRKGMKACVNKGAKKGFNITLDSHDIKGFYSLYCRRMHELGTPVHTFSFFRNILDIFSDSTVATIDYKGEILASQILLYFKDTVIYGWGASSNRYSEWHPVHTLLWKVIQDCIAKGYIYLDLGRSTQDSGTYNFKKWWGAEPRPLYYQYSFVKEQEIPFVHPSNSKYGIAIKIWQTLPLPIANWLGPIVRKNLV
jgi:FemAB-related protein (PEP-CTERM system-associated)